MVGVVCGEDLWGRGQDEPWGPWGLGVMACIFATNRMSRFGD